MATNLKTGAGAKAGSIKKFSFKGQVSADAKKKEAGAAGYAGEKPPPGAYAVTLKRLWMESWKNGTISALRMLFEIDEPKGSPRAKYNGYAIWNGQGITDQGAGYVNQFLKSIGGDEADELVDMFWEEGVKTKADEKGVQHVISIGDFKVGSPNASFQLVVTTKMGKPYKGETKLEVVGYVPLAESKLSDGSEEDETPDDAFEPDETDEIGDTVVEDEAEEAEQDEADSDEGDEDEDDFFGDEE